MNPLTSDTLEILRSSRWPMTVDDVRLELNMWPLHRGEKMRRVKLEDVLEVLLDLFSRGEVANENGMWKSKVAAQKEAQRSLF